MGSGGCKVCPYRLDKLSDLNLTSPPGSPGGVDMNSQMKRGTLELCALSVVSRGDCYGYELVNRISRCMEITEGTIYPLMKRLKESGLIDSYIVESTEGPPRKYYKITEDGGIELEKLSQEWYEFAESINTLLKGEDSDDESNQQAGIL